nr:hypothetical protein [Sphingobium chungbukense]
MRYGFETNGADRTGRGISPVRASFDDPKELKRFNREHQAVAIDVTNDGWGAQDSGDSAHLEQRLCAREIGQHVRRAGLVAIGEVVRHLLLRLHALEDRPPDQLGDLRDYGVSAGSNSVHPIGNPISHSCRHGFVREGIYVPRRSAALRELLPPALDMPLLRGVGNISRDPNSISDMGGAKVASLNAVPARIIPERGQVTENAGEPLSTGSRKEFWHVFHDRKCGSNFANKTGELAPKAGALAINSRSLSSFRQVLAGEASADDIDGNSVSGQSVGCEFSNVMIARHLRPVFRQHAAGKFFDLAKGDRLETASALKAKAETADAAEQVEDAQLLAPPNLMCGGHAAAFRASTSAVISRIRLPMAARGIA